jgi:hypothetical protein
MKNQEKIVFYSPDSDDYVTTLIPLINGKDIVESAGVSVRLGESYFFISFFASLFLVH